MTLTKQDLNAIRKADDLVFRTGADGTSTIEAIKRVDWNEKERNPFTDDRRYAIEVRGHFQTYNGDVHSRACYIAHCIQSHTSYMATVVSLLRVGDELELWWKPDANTNDYLKHAQGKFPPETNTDGRMTGGWSFGALHGDVLHLIVTRGKRRLTFFIGSTVCPDNDARMIR